MLKLNIWKSLKETEKVILTENEWEVSGGRAPEGMAETKFGEKKRKKLKKVIKMVCIYNT